MHRDVHTQECSARSSAHLTVVHWPLHVGIPGILHGCNIDVDIDTDIDMDVI